MTALQPSRVPEESDTGASLAALHARIAPRFRRREVRERVYRYLTALVESAGRRTGRQLAAAAREGRPDGMQRLLRDANWDAEALRDDLREYVVEHLGDPEAVLVILEAGFEKRGQASAGVARQRVGGSRTPLNCQVRIFLGYASRRGTAFLDRALYLPPPWHDDWEQRAKAHIPPSIGKQSKAEIGRELIERALASTVPHTWIYRDVPYGGTVASVSGLPISLASTCWESPRPASRWFTTTRGIRVVLKTCWLGFDHVSGSLLSAMMLEVRAEPTSGHACAYRQAIRKGGSGGSWCGVTKRVPEQTPFSGPSIAAAPAWKTSFTSWMHVAGSTAPSAGRAQGLVLTSTRCAGGMRGIDT